MTTTLFDTQKYPILARSTHKLRFNTNKLIGNDDILENIRAIFHKREMSNALLIAEAGGGKTATVQEFARRYQDQYLVLESSISQLQFNGVENLGRNFKELFNELSRYRQNEVGKRKLVLFMDEFHQLPMDAPAAVEDLKPEFARSAQLGIHLIGATTYKEFIQYIRENDALTQRFQTINMPIADSEKTFTILKSRMAQQDDVIETPQTDKILREIIYYTDTYIKDKIQPRKSTDILDQMLGWVGIGRKFDHKLLGQVIYRATNVRIDLQLDPTHLEDYLNSRVYNQPMAVKAIIGNAYSAILGVTNPKKPRGAFLFVGSTGVGKALTNAENIPIPTKEGYKKNGDLKVGDYVYNAHGKPVKVTGVFPKPAKDVYRLTLVDGRHIDCAADHLWTYRSHYGNGAKTWKTISTVELMKKRISVMRPNGRVEHQFAIPQNEALERQALKYELDPYVLGAFIGNASFVQPYVSFSSNDKKTLTEISELLNYPYKRQHDKNHNYVFITGKYRTTHDKLLQTRDALCEVPELIGTKSGNKFIPEMYKFGSIDQRWALIQGLFDTDGTIEGSSRFNVSYSTTSKRLACDIQEVLWSLGIMSSINKHSNDRANKPSDSFEYRLHVKVQNKDKYKFFRLPRKLKRAYEAQKISKKREKKFDVIAIKSIKKLPKKADMTCIMVDDPEHLYVAGRQHIVTHNTELAKAFTTALFGEDAQLTTFDMAEYQNEDDVALFQQRLTDRMLSVNTPVILLDEIEKANPGIGTLLFSVLDEARLADHDGREVNFSNVFFFFTTNAGSKVFEELAGRDYSDEEANEQLADFDRLIFNQLKADRTFPDPLLGRMTGFVPFNPLTPATNEKIARRQLKKVATTFLSKQNVKVRYDESNVLRYITSEKLRTDADAGGARQIVNLINSDVTNAISKYLVFHPDHTDVTVTTKGTARTLNKNQLASDEVINVVATSKNVLDFEYKQAVAKYKNALIKVFSQLKSKGYKLSIKQKAIFTSLSQVSTMDAKSTFAKFIAPLKDYLQHPTSKSIVISASSGQLLITPVLTR